MQKIVPVAGTAEFSLRRQAFAKVNLSEADRALGELAGLGRTLPNPNLLIRPFIRREAVLSAGIEGTQADVADLYAYEAKQLALPLGPSAATDTDVREVFNYVRALEYGLERLTTLPVSLRLIREVPDILMKGYAASLPHPANFAARKTGLADRDVL